MTLKGNFRRGGGFNLKNLPWEGYGYFLEQHNTICGIMLQSHVLHAMYRAPSGEKGCKVPSLQTKAGSPLPSPVVWGKRVGRESICNSNRKRVTQNKIQTL